MNPFKLNQEILEAQQRDFTRGGAILKNIFSISAQHPWLSSGFVLSFGLLTNALFDFAKYVTSTDSFELRGLLLSLLLVALFVLVPCLILVRVRRLHMDLIKSVPITQKKVLVTVASRSNDFKDMPSYCTYESLIYTHTGHPSQNALQKVVIVASESPDVLTSAQSLKNHIEASGRAADIYGVTINNKLLSDIQAQLESMFNGLKATYSPHDMIADYTGGTKEMSVALFRASEKELILPIYLNSAATGNHSKYN